MDNHQIRLEAMRIAIENVKDGQFGDAVKMAADKIVEYVHADDPKVTLVDDSRPDIEGADRTTAPIYQSECKADYTAPYKGHTFPDRYTEPPPYTPMEYPRNDFRRPIKRS